MISRRWLSSCFSRPRGYDQIGHLRRQEAPQPAHAFDFAVLGRRRALFESPVELRQAPGTALPPAHGSLAQSLEQSGVLNGNDGLGRRSSVTKSQSALSVNGSARPGGRQPKHSRLARRPLSIGARLRIVRTGGCIVRRQRRPLRFFLGRARADLLPRRDVVAVIDAAARAAKKGIVEPGGSTGEALSAILSKSLRWMR